MIRKQATTYSLRLPDIRKPDCILSAKNNLLVCVANIDQSEKMCTIYSIKYQNRYVRGGSRNFRWGGRVHPYMSSPPLPPLPSPWSGGPRVYPRTNFEILLCCRWFFAHLCNKKYDVQRKSFVMRKYLNCFWQVQFKAFHVYCSFIHYYITTGDAP